MPTNIIFFHGYASSPKAEKFQKLTARFGADRVFAFAADLHPDIAKKEVLAQIQQLLIEAEQGLQLVLVGSSMGCWLAAHLLPELAKQVPCHLVLINPCLDPANLRHEHPDHADLLKLYTPVAPLPRAQYFIASNDEVIDHSSILTALEGTDYLSIFDAADHRFNGPEFTSVLDHIAKILTID